MTSCYQSHVIHRHRPKSSTTFHGILIKILFFHSRVKKFQNNIYFICNCVNSVNRDDMFKMATGLDGVILAVSIFMLFNRIIDYPAKLELRTLSCMIEDLGFYANNINSTLYDDSVVEKFTPQKQNLRSVRNAITQTPNIITTIISMPYVYSFYYLETFL